MPTVALYFLYMYKYIRIIIGIIILLAGIGFFVVPFLPIGYILIFTGAVLLAPEIPLFRRFFQWLESKDKSGRLKKVLNKIYQFTDKNGSDNNEPASEDQLMKKEKHMQ